MASLARLALVAGVCATFFSLYPPLNTQTFVLDIYIAWSVLYVAPNPIISSVEYAAKNGHVDNLASLCRDCGQLE